MKGKIDSLKGRLIYSRRLGTAEPVLGNICSAFGLNRFTLRGKRKVKTQWRLYCVVPTRPGAKPCMRFLFPGSSPGQAMSRTFALRLPSDPSSRRRPPILGIFDLPSARTFGSIHYLEYHRFSYRGLLAWP
jgi:hypothetical protein